MVTQKITLIRTITYEQAFEIQSEQELSTEELAKLQAALAYDQSTPDMLEVNESEEFFQTNAINGLSEPLVLEVKKIDDRLKASIIKPYVSELPMLDEITIIGDHIFN